MDTTHWPHVTSHRYDANGKLIAHGLLEWHHMLPSYPPEQSGYYLKRGHFVDQCCAILARRPSDIALDDRTKALARIPREKPLSDGQLEAWGDYVDQFVDWMRAQRNMVFVAAQEHVTHHTLMYQGTYDLFVEIDERPTLVDIKCGDCPPVTAIQLALYDRARAPYGPGPYQAQRIGLELHPDKYVVHDYSSQWRDYDRAQRLAQAYWDAREYA